MPRISNEKVEKIKEQILFFLFSNFPKQIFTADIAKEMARDEEFIKKLLLDLEKSDLVVRISQNSRGIKYERRIRWRISNKAHTIYTEHQSKQEKTNQLANEISEKGLI